MIRGCAEKKESFGRFWPSVVVAALAPTLASRPGLPAPRAPHTSGSRQIPSDRWPLALSQEKTNTLFFHRRVHQGRQPSYGFWAARFARSPSSKLNTRVLGIQSARLVPSNRLRDRRPGFDRASQRGCNPNTSLGLVDTTRNPCPPARCHAFQKQSQASKLPEVHAAQDCQCFEFDQPSTHVQSKQKEDLDGY